MLYFCAAKPLRQYPGVLFLIYIAGYSLGRMLIEPIRTDSIQAFGMAAPSLVSEISLALAIIGIGIVLTYYRKHPAKIPADAMAAVGKTDGGGATEAPKPSSDSTSTKSEEPQPESPKPSTEETAPSKEPSSEATEKS